MTSCKLFHSPVTSFDLSREGEFEISLAQGNFLEYLEEKGRKSGKGRVQVGEKRVQRGKRKGNGTLQWERKWHGRERRSI